MGLWVGSASRLRHWPTSIYGTSYHRDWFVDFVSRAAPVVLSGTNSNRSKRRHASMDRIAQYWLGEEAERWKQALKNWKQILLIVLGLPIIGWTVVATWAVSRLSAFVVNCAWVRMYMEKWGYGLELRLAGAIQHLRSLGLFPVVVFLVIAFVAVLWWDCRVGNPRRTPATA